MPVKHGEGQEWKQGFELVCAKAAEKRVTVSGRCLLSGSGRRTLILQTVFVPPEDRGWGIGSGIIRGILAWADQAGTTVRLTPDATFAGMSLPRLERFWRSFGFVPNQGANGDPVFAQSLVRAPLAEEDLAALPK